MIRKGQFFIITAVMIISVLFSTAKVFIAYSNFDLNEVKRFGVGFTIHNIENKFSEAKTFRETPNTPSNQEKELKKHLEDWAFQRGYLLEVNLSSCDQIKLKSVYFELEKEIC